jgi:hypothetical protein
MWGSHVYDSPHTKILKEVQDSETLSQLGQGQGATLVAIFIDPSDMLELRVYRLGETWPAATGLILVGGREERLTRLDIDVDPSFLIAEMLAGSRALGSALFV